MKYQVQKRNGPGLELLDSLPRVQGQLNDQRAETTALAQETKSLRAEVIELRSQFTTLGRRVDAVQAESAEARRELGQVTEQVVQFSSHLESLVQALQASHGAASATTQALEAQREGDLQQQQEIHAALQQQHGEQEALALALRQGRQQIGEQLEALIQKEAQLQQNAGEVARTLVELVQKGDQQAARRLDAICAVIQRSAEEELGGLSQMAESFQQARDCERNLADLLAAGNAALNNLTCHAEQILIQDRRARQERLRSEAASLNSLGLKSFANGRHDEASRKFEQARELAPAAFEPRFNLAVARFGQGDTDSVSKLMDELERDFPGRPELKPLRGLISLAAGDFAAARDALAAVAEAGTQDGSIQAATGLAHLLNGDAQSAKAAMRRVARVAGSETQFFRRVGFEAATAV